MREIPERLQAYRLVEPHEDPLFSTCQVEGFKIIVNPLKNTNFLEKFDFRNQVAVVTGAAGIIGSKVSEAFLRLGANVAILDQNEKHLTEFTDHLKEKWSDQILPLTCDVTNPSSVKQSVSKIVQKWGTIHILHNNAASKSSDLKKFFAPFEKYDLEIWNEIMSVNVNGMMLMAQAVGQTMIDKKTSGSIIQTASIYGVVAPDLSIYEGSHYLGGPISLPAVYSASKGAVISLSRYLAAYWAPHGIRVNSITPGGVESGQNQTFTEKYSKRVPMGRMANVDEIVDGVLYLSSPASSYMTGQNLIIDGGLTAW